MNSCRGNAFVYILIAVVLLAGLTYTIGKSNQGADPVGELDDSKVKITANAIISYSAATQQALLQMDQIGVATDDVDFMLPDDIDFNNAPTTEKLFHPDGGGLVYKHLPAGSEGAYLPPSPVPDRGYYVGLIGNVEWTPTTAKEIMFVAYGISEKLCQELNWQIIRQRTTPEVQSAIANTLVPEEFLTGSNTDFMESNCPECDGKPALCVSDDGGGGPSSIYAFYSIMVAR